MLQIRSLMECEKRERLDSRQSAETSLGPGVSFFAGVNYAKVKSRPTRVSFIYRGGYTFPGWGGDIPTVQLQPQLRLRLNRGAFSARISVVLVRLRLNCTQPLSRIVYLRRCNAKLMDAKEKKFARHL